MHNLIKTFYWQAHQKYWDGQQKHWKSKWYEKKQLEENFCMELGLRLRIKEAF